MAEPETWHPDIGVWTDANGVILPCEHPASMRKGGASCCHQWTLSGLPLDEAVAGLAAASARLMAKKEADHE